MLIRTSVRGFANQVYKSAHSLWAMGVCVPKHRNILALLGTESGPVLIPGCNIVTDAGDLYYAQRSAGEASTNAFGVHELCSAGTPAKGANRSAFTTIASTEKLHAATYPKTNDGDADNTGAGTDIVTYLASYGKADFSHAAITHGIVTNATPGAAEPIMTGYAFAAAFGKTSNDTLKVFVNHNMNGI